MTASDPSSEAPHISQPSGATKTSRPSAFDQRTARPSASIPAENLPCEEWTISVARKVPLYVTGDRIDDDTSL